MSQLKCPIVLAKTYGLLRRATIVDRADSYCMVRTHAPFEFIGFRLQTVAVSFKDIYPMNDFAAELLAALRAEVV